MKGFKTIFGVLATASLLFSFNASAQENNNRDENGKIVRGAYETNRALDNTFITIAGGINSVFDDSPAGSNPTDPSKYVLGKIGFGTEIDFGKWFTPSVGARFGWHGCNNEPKIGPWNQASEMQLPWNFIHGDLLWNISNAIGGYKETRVWNLVPYLTGGLSMIKHHDLKMYDQEFAGGAGLLNSFRLGERVNLNIDLGVILARAEAYKMKGFVGRYVGFPSATLGLQFNLGRTGFDRLSSVMPVIVPVPFTEAQYNDLKNKVAALERENAQLKNKIADLENQLAPFKNLVDGQTYLFQNGRFTAVEAKVASPATVYFDLGSAKISDREKAHLEFFANSAVDNATKLLLTGSADKQTGSAKGNQKLSEKRVDAVKALLEKLGANGSNIETVANGDTKNVFDTPAKNRCVVIEVK